MKSRRFAPVFALLFCGCSLSPLVRDSAIDYNQVEEEVNNQALVINILRARDNAPLYIAEFQEVRATYSATIGTGSIVLPFGPGHPPISKRNSAAPSASLQIQPSFAIDQLDTQQFTLGMLHPIEPITWEYYWHREYEPRVLIHLFIQEIGEGDNKFENQPCAPANADQATGAACADYNSFTQFVDEKMQDGIYLNAFTRVTAIPESNSTSANHSASSSPNATKSDVETATIEGKTYRLSREPSQVAICTKAEEQEAAKNNNETWWKALEKYQRSPCGDDGKNNVALTPPQAHLFECTHSAIIECQQRWDDLQQQIDQGQFYVLRSVDGIIHYLGEVQRRVDTDPSPDDAKKGVTWTESDGIHTLFQLHRTPGNDRIEVEYQGTHYYVREGDPTDHTLQVLSLLGQLINANKIANEIPTTKAVQIVP